MEVRPYKCVAYVERCCLEVLSWTRLATCAPTRQLLMVRRDQLYKQVSAYKKLRKIKFNNSNTLLGKNKNFSK